MALGTPSPGPWGDMPPDDALARAVPRDRDIPWRQRDAAPHSRQRWTIGGVYPRASARDGRPRRSHVSTELIVRGRLPRLSVEARFLQIVDRELLRTADDGGVERADEIVAGDARLLAGEEARERALIVERVRLDGAGSARTPIAISAGSDREAIGEHEVVVRRWAALVGELEVRWNRLEPEVLRVGVTVSNVGGWRVAEWDDANRHAMMAAHVLLQVEGGAFVSSLEPPQELERAVLGCRNEGLFPVLLGGPAAHDRVLASPVILYDRPDLSRESQGGLFDDTQIDHRVILGTLAASEAERGAVRAPDPCHGAEPAALASATASTPAIASLSPEATVRLNGAIRDWQVLRPFGVIGEGAARGRRPAPAELDRLEWLGAEPSGSPDAGQA